MLLRDASTPFLAALVLSCTACTSLEMCAAQWRLKPEPPRSFKGVWCTTRNAILTVLFMHLPLNVPTEQSLGPLSCWRVLAWVLLADFWFGAAHWCMHSRWLYALHKEHHTDTNPTTATDVLKCGLLEYGLVNMASVAIGPTVLPCTEAATAAWVAVATTAAVLAHSSLRCSKKHYLHHTLHNVNYSTGMYVFDRIMGTLRD